MYVIRFLLVIVAGGSFSYAAASEFKSLDTVRSEFLSSGDMTRLEYALIRCSGLQIALGALTLKNGMKDASDKLLFSSFQYVQAAQVVHDSVSEERGVVDRGSFDSLSKAAQRVSKIYAEKMATNWSTHGDYLIQDEALMKEVDLCTKQSSFIDWMTN